MTHDHHVHEHVPRRTVVTALAVTLAAAGIEFMGSWYGGSLFLFADAVHLVAHIGIFAVLLVPAVRWHERGEDLVTLAVLALVVLIALGLIMNSGHELFVLPGERPNPASMLLAVFGLGANLTTAILFAAPSKTRWSFRAALAHELSDGAVTVFGLIGALVIYLFDWHWVDPALSLLVGLWLWIWAARLLVRWMRLGRGAWMVE